MARFGTFLHGAVTRQEQACLASFVRLGHEVSVFAYDFVDLPIGVTWRDAAAILPFDELYQVDTGPNRGNFAQFSDRFRYLMIRRTGLIWIDTDVFCLRADWPEDEYLLAAQDTCLVNGAVLGLPRESRFLDDAIEASARLGSLPVWALTGPYLLTALVHQHRIAKRVRPSVSFYPIHYRNAAALVEPRPAGEPMRWPDASYCVHFWNEALRMAGHDKIAGPAPGSAMAALFDLVAPYLPAPRRGGSG